MKKHIFELTFVVTLALSIGTGEAMAKVVDIVWTASGQFKHEGAVAAGKLLELCGPIGVGKRVNWAFESAEPLEGNVHVHVGKDVVYPTKFSALSAAQGQLVAAQPEDHCWMWTNKSLVPVQLKAELKRLP